MLPLHYTDSCIFLEVFSKERNNKSNECQSYLYNIGKSHKGIISILSLGEISKSFLMEFKEVKSLELSFEKLKEDLFKPFQLTSSQFEDYKLSLELRKIHNHLEPADSLHIAMAINNKAKFFVTLGEKDLINNQKFREFCKNKGLKFKTLD
ncbi:MAG: PIN domain-containing protein [Nanoarchaeota archaeon]|nr:PIN domain-containing protein [Nanoarchaeota archaeon]